VLRQLIAAVAPQFVYINLIFSPLFAIYPVWLAYTGKLSAKLILCPRGTLFKSALAVKTYKKLPLLKIYRWLGIQKGISFHATTTQEAEAVLNYFPGSDVVIAPNLPAINQPAYAELEKKEGELACIFVARIVPIKNLLYVIDVLKTASFRVQLTIVGPIEDEQYWEHCKSKIATLPFNVVINFLGAQPATAIPALLQKHHLFFLPTTGENFGHSIFEALSVGRPVLISDQTPWLDLDKENCGWHFPLAQTSLFVEKLHDLAAMQQAGFNALSQRAWAYAKRYIENGELTKPYYELFS
jgi:glycosyltransferase involved in cell wall biosynthesis